MLRFEQLAEELLEAKQAGRRYKTYLAARTQLKHLIKTFEGRRVRFMNRASWNEHVIRAKGENPSRNLNDDLKYFRQVMGLAYAKGILKNPIGAISKPDLESDLGRELNDEEIARLFSHAPHDELRFLMETALRLGWRLNEMRQCLWSWVDFHARAIRLPASSIKTKKSRNLPIPNDILERLALRPRVSKFVFPSPFNPQKPILIRKAWEKTKREAGVACRWHDLRHTCATRMVRAGVNEIQICKVLGMSPKVLRRIYEHLNLDDLRHAVEVVRIPHTVHAQ